MIKMTPITAVLLLGCATVSNQRGTAHTEECPTPTPDVRLMEPGGNYTATLGNGKVERGEECDDGNTLAGDGCSSEGIVEAGYVCAIPGMPCEQTAVGGILYTFGCDVYYSRMWLLAAGRLDPAVQTTNGRNEWVNGYKVDVSMETMLTVVLGRKHFLEFIIADTSGTGRPYVGGLEYSYRTKSTFIFGVSLMGVSAVGDSAVELQSGAGYIKPKMSASGIGVSIGQRWGGDGFPLVLGWRLAPFIALPGKSDNTTTGFVPGVFISFEAGLALLSALDRLQH